MNKSKEEESKRIKEISVDILKEFIRICDKYELNWFVAYGTAIGTVRHQGFIPWDDDMDVIMWREDYEKFMKVAPKEINKQYAICGAEIQHQVQGFYLQMYKKGTMFMTKWNARWKIHPGIKLDIFPYDKVPADLKKRKEIYKKTKRLCFFYKSRNVKIPYTPTKKMKDILLKVAYFVMHYILKICGKSEKYLAEEFVKVAKSYKGDSKGYRVLIESPDPDRWMIKESEVLPLQTAKFEGVEVKLPAKNHDILTRQYGNYMVLPKIQEQVGYNLEKIKVK